MVETSYCEVTRQQSVKTEIASHRPPDDAHYDKPPHEEYPHIVEAAPYTFIQLAIHSKPDLAEDRSWCPLRWFSSSIDAIDSE